MNIRYSYISSLLQILQFSYKHKLSHTHITITKKLFKTLFLLQKLGLIYAYIPTVNGAILYLKYLHQQPVLQSIHFFSKKSHNYYIGYKTLYNLLFKPTLSTTIFILKTKFGILSGIEAIKHRVGGILLVKIN